MGSLWKGSEYVEVFLVEKQFVEEICLVENSFRFFSINSPVLGMTLYHSFRFFGKAPSCSEIN